MPKPRSGRYRDKNSRHFHSNPVEFNVDLTRSLSILSLLPTEILTKICRQYLTSTDAFHVAKSCSSLEFLLDVHTLWLSDVSHPKRRFMHALSELLFSFPTGQIRQIADHFEESSPHDQPWQPPPSAAFQPYGSPWFLSRRRQIRFDGKTCHYGIVPTEVASPFVLVYAFMKPDGVLHLQPWKSEPMPEMEAEYVRDIEVPLREIYPEETFETCTYFICHEVFVVCSKNGYILGIDLLESGKILYENSFRHAHCLTALRHRWIVVHWETKLDIFDVSQNLDTPIFSSEVTIEESKIPVDLSRDKVAIGSGKKILVFDRGEEEETCERSFEEDVVNVTIDQARDILFVETRQDDIHSVRIFNLNAIQEAEVSEKLSQRGNWSYHVGLCSTNLWGNFERFTFSVVGKEVTPTVSITRCNNSTFMDTKMTWRKEGLAKANKL